MDESRHALVCGASQGIGEATAIELAKQGNTVTLLARSVDSLERVAQACLDAGAPAAHVLAADLDERDDAIERLTSHLNSNGPIHILINNTGGPPSGRLLDATDDAFLTAFGRHVLMAQRMVQTLLPGMEKAGFGRIVNVLSTSVREPIPNLGVSNTIRAAMASWAKTVSRELPPGVTINSIMPGFTDTPRLTSLANSISASKNVEADEVMAGWVAATPEGRLGRPEELGAAIAFLCSPAASFVRGVVLPVDGGRLHSI